MSMDHVSGCDWYAFGDCDCTIFPPANYVYEEKRGTPWSTYGPTVISAEQMDQLRAMLMKGTP